MGGEQRHSSTGSNFRHSQTEEGAGKQERPSSAGAKNRKSDSRQEETSSGAGKDKPSSEDHKKTDPRVAQETAADSAAADLIAKVDLELDQAQSKDNNHAVTRAVFKVVLVVFARLSRPHRRLLKGTSDLEKAFQDHLKHSPILFKGLF